MEYLSDRHDVIFATFAGYQNEEAALNTGMILNEMLRHEQLCNILLYSNEWVLFGLTVSSHKSTLRFYEFPHFIETPTFGVSCDAFANMKETLTRHKSMVAEYLDKNYDRVSGTPMSLIPYYAHFKASSSHLLQLLFFRITTWQSGSHWSFLEKSF